MGQKREVQTSFIICQKLTGKPRRASSKGGLVRKGKSQALEKEIVVLATPEYIAVGPRLPWEKYR